MDKTYWSQATGVIIKLDPSASRAGATVISNGGHALDSETCHALSYICDWEEVEKVDSDFLAHANVQSRSHRAIAYIRLLLLGMPETVGRDALSELERIISQGIDKDVLLAEILIAPLADVSGAQKISGSAASNGCGAAAELLNQMLDAQPHLVKLVAAWHSIPTDKFIAATIAKQDLWGNLVSARIVLGMVRANSILEFNKTWISYIDSVGSVDRRPVMEIMTLLAESVFPLSVTPEVPPLQEGDSPRAGRRSEEKKSVSRFELTYRSEAEAKNELKLRALKQVNAIAKMVAGGRDDLGIEWLGDLIANHASDDNPEHVSKSLCNLAKQCADMYRYDFERKCLLRGMEINPSDVWTRIQWGTHLKRLGQFDDALDVFQGLIGRGHDIIVSSSMADILAQRGEYDRAIVAYKKIDGWNNEPSILISIANIHRKTGSVAEAWGEFEEVASRWNSHRAFAGFAEIKKQSLEFDSALEMYDRLLGDENMDPRSLIIYKSARANVYKAMGQLPEAYEAFDRIVRDYPYFMQARVQKAAVLGLLGEAQRGLNGIPASVGPKGFGDWLKLYIRGLLLLKLHRYDDAQNELVKNAGDALEVGSERRMLQLGAAVAFLSRSQFGLASERLGATVGGSLFVNYIEHVLRLHVAVAQADQASIAAIEKKIRAAERAPRAITLVCENLRKGDVAKAAESEVGLLLQAV